MKKLSLAKIIAALVIVNCYMFTCGVMGTVGDAQMLTEDTSEEHSETAAPAGDIDQAEGQGTLDFLVPDETGTGVVQINLLNMAPMSLSDKMVMSTYSALSDELPQPQEATDEILGEDDSTLEPTSETYDSEEILGPREETEEIPAVTTPPATTSDDRCDNNDNGNDCADKRRGFDDYHGEGHRRYPGGRRRRSAGKLRE